jgi:hypothetical protein
VSFGDHGTVKIDHNAINGAIFGQRLLDLFGNKVKYLFGLMTL